jgi:hypothetical protein
MHDAPRHSLGNTSHPSEEPFILLFQLAEFRVHQKHAKSHSSIDHGFANLKETSQQPVFRLSLAQPAA